MTDQLQLLTLVPRQFYLREDTRYAYGKDGSDREPLTPQQAQERVQEALLAQDVSLQDVAPFLGALLVGTPAELLLEESYPRASCDCCNDHVKVFLVVV
jgi:hypothetical protein